MRMVGPGGLEPATSPELNSCAHFVAIVEPGVARNISLSQNGVFPRRNLGGHKWSEPATNKEVQLEVMMRLAIEPGLPGCWLHLADAGKRTFGR
jgi:hypothetical protein